MNDEYWCAQFVRGSALEIHTSRFDRLVRFSRLSNVPQFNASVDAICIMCKVDLPCLHYDPLG